MRGRTSSSTRLWIRRRTRRTRRLAVVEARPGEERGPVAAEAPLQQLRLEPLAGHELDAERQRRYRADRAAHQQELARDGFRVLAEERDVEQLVHLVVGCFTGARGPGPGEVGAHGGGAHER